MAGKAIHVLDYPAMGRPGKPRKLHATDCYHEPEGIYRAATAQELATLDKCEYCERHES
jgi:hypothetical protein